MTLRKETTDMSDRLNSVDYAKTVTRTRPTISSPDDACGWAETECLNHLNALSDLANASIRALTTRKENDPDAKTPPNA